MDERVEIGEGVECTTIVDVGNGVRRFVRSGKVVVEPMSGGWDYLQKLKDEDRAAVRRSHSVKLRGLGEQEARQCLRDLLDLTSGLSLWEVEFLDSVNNWNGSLTEKQRNTIDKIHQERMPK